MIQILLTDVTRHVYRSPFRYLRPAEACVVFVGRRHGGGIGSTLVFSLTTVIDNITPRHTVKVEAPCYEMHRVPLDVSNPFHESGTFRVVLVESRDEGGTFGGGKLGQSLGVQKKKKPKKIKYVFCYYVILINHPRHRWL